MSFATVFSKLLKRDTEARTAAAGDYRSLVRDAASDRPVSQTQIETTLAAAGKSLADLADDVAAEQQRLAHLTTVGRRDELLAELAELAKQEATEQEAFAVAYRDLLEGHRERGADFQQRRTVITGDLDKCNAAERSLMRDGRLDQIRAELGQLVRDEQRALARYGGLRSRIPPESLNGGITVGRLARIDQRRQELADEQAEIERELLVAN